MALFSFFRKVPHQQFKYHPRFYDERREELQARLDAVEALKDQESNPDQIKERIKGSFKKGGTTYYDRKDAGQYFNKRSSSKNTSTTILLLSIVALIALTYVILYVYLPRLEELIQ